MLVWASMCGIAQSQKIATNALHFDGKDDYVDLPDFSDSFDFSKGFSFTAWVKWDALSGNARLFELTNGYGYLLNSIIFRINDSGVLVLQCSKGADNSEIITDAAVVATGKWYHVAATISSQGEANIYIDGKSVKSGGVYIPVNDYRKNNWLGKSTWSSDKYFSGAMDEVSFWSKALTPSEIVNAKAKGFAGWEPNLIAYYTFDQGVVGGVNSSITSLTNKTANVFNGTLTNFALSGNSSNWIKGVDVEHKLLMSESTLSYGCLANESKRIKIASNIEWVLSGTAEWLGISQNSGSGDATLILTALQANNASTERTVTLTLKGKDDSMTTTLTVSQSGVTPTLVIKKEGDFVFEKVSNNAITFMIESNTSWSFSNVPDWLNLAIPSGNGYKMNSFKTVSDNPWGFKREAEITLSGVGVDPIVFKVEQKGAEEYMDFSTTNVSLGKKAGSSATIAINTNIKWRVIGYKGKLKIEPMEGLGSSDIVFTTTADNATSNPIQEIVNIMGMGIVVIQKTTTNELSASQSNLLLGKEAGNSATLNIVSNTNWHFEGHEGNLVITPSSGTGNGTVTVAAAKASSGHLNASYALLLRGDDAEDFHVSVVQQSPYMPNGSGTEQAPFQISNLDHLLWMSANLTDNSPYVNACYALTNDIDAWATQQLPNGFESIPNYNVRSSFNGKFDGKGFAIHNLYSHSSFFSNVSNQAIIQNLGLVNLRMTDVNSAGGFVSRNQGKIDACFAVGNMDGISAAIFAYENEGEIANCYASGHISGESSAGFCFYNNGNIMKSYASVAFSQDDDNEPFIYNSPGAANGYYNSSLFSTSQGYRGLTTSEMKQVASFSDPLLDFVNDWSVNDGKSFPRLKGVYNYPLVMATYPMDGTIGMPYSATIDIVEMDYPVTSVVLSEAPQGMSFDKGVLRWLPASGGNHRVRLTITDANGKTADHVFYINVPLAGEGTESNPYKIFTISDLDFVRNNVSAAYMLMNDLNFEGSKYSKSNGGSGWSPIFNFSGVFFGQGYTIKNLYVNTNDLTHAGLFGNIYDANIINLGLAGVDVTGIKYVGGLCGAASNSQIEYCFTTGHVDGCATGKDFTYTGGLVGHSYNSAIINCYNTAQVAHGNSVGGIAGQIRNGRIKDCYSAAHIGEGTYKGGIVGVCYEDASVDGYFNSQVGGLTQGCGNLILGTVNATPLTTQQMLIKSNFVNWDFSTTWVIDEGKTYPVLFVSKNNAPFAFADRIDVSVRINLSRILENDYDYEKNQDNLVVRVSHLEGPATLDELQTYVLFNRDAEELDVATLHYQVGEVVAPGDILWGGYAVAQFVKSMQVGPDAGSHTVTINEDESLTNFDLAAISTDYNKDYLTLYSVDYDKTLHGTVVCNGNTITYTPHADFNGRDEIHYSITDGRDFSRGELIVNISPVNDAPTIQTVDSKTIHKNESLTISMDDITANDVDGDVLYFRVVAGNHYSVSGSEVTPDAGFVGQLKVGIIVNDGFLDSNVMEMMVDVVPSTGIDHADADAVALYPNPCRDYITVIASGRISRVSIINLAGQTIQIENNPQERILVSSLMRGVYLVKIETNDGHDTVMRLVKQ